MIENDVIIGNLIYLKELQSFDNVRNDATHLGLIVQATRLKDSDKVYLIRIINQ